MLEDQRAQSSFRNLLDYVAGLLLDNKTNLLHRDTLKYTSELVVKSGLQSLEQNLSDILNAVDIKKVTETQVNSMEPQKIKELFESFVRPYFRKLEFYGLFGGVVGLAARLPSYATQMLQLFTTGK